MNTTESQIRNVSIDAAMELAMSRFNDIEPQIVESAFHTIGSMLTDYSYDEKQESQIFARHAEQIQNEIVESCEEGTPQLVIAMRMVSYMAIAFSNIASDARSATGQKIPAEFKDALMLAITGMASLTEQDLDSLADFEESKKVKLRVVN